jgi:predicted nuclease with TOPRIM domain
VSTEPWAIQTRGALLHTQAENLELERRTRELEAEKAALEHRVQTLEREAALPPDPFADPIPPSRS